MAGAAVPDFDERLAVFTSATFKDLRPGQRQVLSAYAADHLDTTDLAIEMPTGEGKTLLALLIADWALDQGQSVAYLTGTRQLAERAEEEAEKLGLDTVRFASKGTVNLSSPRAIFAGSPPRFTRSRVTYEAYAVSRTSTRPQVDSAVAMVFAHRVATSHATSAFGGLGGLEKSVLSRPAAA